jgi:hypothetical protein
MKHVIRPLPLALAFASLGAAVLLTIRTGANWWLIPIGLIGPDLSFLAAIGGPAQVDGNMPPRVVRPYNLVHHPAGPAMALAVGAALPSGALITLAIAWGSHLLWDRGVGYGLRRADGSVIHRAPLRL